MAFEVGDNVEVKFKGKGVVVKIDTFVTNYPVWVELEDGSKEVFTVFGTRSMTNSEQHLFKIKM